MEEWEQFQKDLLTSVRVANDFKTEAQRSHEKLEQENQMLKERLRQLDTDLEKARGKGSDEDVRSQDFDSKATLAKDFFAYTLVRSQNFLLNFEDY